MIKTYRNSNKACHTHILMSLLCLFLISFIPACDNSTGNDQDATGTASFQIQWPEDDTSGVAASQWLVSADGSGSAEMLTGAATVTVSEDCHSRGIDKVAVEVRDAAENLLVSKEFACSAGVGKISVPVGTGRLFSISGLGGDGEIRYYGGKDDVTIRAGSNDIGVIQMERSPAFCTDNDGDGYYVERDCGTAIDCNDNDKNSYPGAIEICGDGIDQDCDGSDEACQPGPNDGGSYYGDFAVTELKYDDDSDWDQKILEIFGSGYRVADWNDLKAYYNKGGDLLSLYDGLGLTDYGASAYVTRNGDPSYSSTRYYFASRHEGTLPSNYLAHDNIGGYTLSLGSWYGTGRILAIKNSLSVPAPAATPASSVTASGFRANWNSVSGATGYRLDVSTSTGFGSFVSGYNNKDVGNVTTRTISGLNAGTTYYYRVRAYNDGGTSNNSNVISVTTDNNNNPGTITNSLGMDFVYIEPGTFMMGSPADEPDRGSDETQHQVTLSKGFYIQITEVTQGQWTAVMGSNPSHFKNCGDDCPVESVSWDDTQSFITALNALGEGTYRLPTEAQWEYACRAGSTRAFANGGITAYQEMYDCNNDPNLSAMGWYCYNSDNKTHPVAQKQANAWGLYDMHGNVWEWCQDWYGTYPSGSVTDPVGPTSGSYRVIRGGGWTGSARYCRSANRHALTPDFRDYIDRGFRVALLPGQ